METYICAIQLLELFLNKNLISQFEMLKTVLNLKNLFKQRSIFLQNQKNYNFGSFKTQFS